MTPCEKLGYKVGDEFVYTGGLWFDKNFKCTLIRDDGTSEPKFSGFLAGYPRSFYVNLDNVTPIRQQENTMRLTDQLESALAALDDAQKTVDRLRAEYRAAYPHIHGIEQPEEDMTDPSNWRAGDVVECVDPEKTNESPYFTKGYQYRICDTDGSDTFRYIDDEGDEMWACNEGFRFVRRP